MFSKSLNFLSKAISKDKNKSLVDLLGANFSARSGPYNPNRYKEYFVPRNLPKNEEIVEFVRSVHTIPGSPIRNSRHVNPVR